MLDFPYENIPIPHPETMIVTDLTSKLTDPRLEKLNDPDTGDSIMNGPITDKEIRLAISSLKSNKASRPDGLTSVLHKYPYQHILPFLTAFLNYLFDKGKFPDSWSEAKIQLLLKTDDTSLPENYRGIYPHFK